MRLYEEAEKIHILGIEGYRFGFFVMMGMMAAVIVIGFLSWAKRCEKGTAPILAFLGILLGAFGLLTPAASALLHNSSTILLSIKCLTGLLEEKGERS